MPPPLTGIDRTEHAKLLDIVIDECLHSHIRLISCRKPATSVSILLRISALKDYRKNASIEFSMQWS